MKKQTKKQETKQSGFRLIIAMLDISLLNLQT